MNPIRRPGRKGAAGRHRFAKRLRNWQFTQNQAKVEVRSSWNRSDGYGHERNRNNITLQKVTHYHSTAVL